MIALQKVFNIQYGHGLELNKLDEDNGEINFISRTAKNNGVSAIVRKINSVKSYYAPELNCRTSPNMNLK